MIRLLAGGALSYLLGSIPTGFLIGKVLCGIDIRQHGSGNVGATNIYRTVGKKWGLIVLGIDTLKGYAAAAWLPSYFHAETLLSPLALSLLYGFLSIAGHTWTFWLRFRGGKGVATSCGVFFAITPQASLASLAIWVTLLFWKRYVSLASLGTSLAFPLWVAFFHYRTEVFALLFATSLTLPLFIFYTHRDNLRRLLKGEEKRIF